MIHIQIFETMIRKLKKNTFLFDHVNIVGTRARSYVEFLNVGPGSLKLIDIVIFGAKHDFGGAIC
jgi:hypothetical protein